MSFYFPCFDKDIEKIMSQYYSYPKINTKKPRKSHKNYINKTIKRNRLKKGVTRMNKDIVEEGVEVSILEVLDNPN